MHPKVLAVAAVVISQKAAFPIEDVEAFLGGLVNGLVQEDHFTNIHNCLVDAQKVDEEITEAIGDFAKKDIQDIVAGVKVLGGLIQELPDDLNTCEAMQPDLKRIEAWATIFKQPKELVARLISNLMHNYQKIITDAQDMTTQVAQKNFKQVGTDAADILVQTLGVVPQDPESIQYTAWH